MVDDNTVYNQKQKKIALVLYVLVAIACLITIGGTVYTIADIIMATGKMVLFQGLNIGYQVAIVGTLLAGLFILVIFFYGLSRKGVNVILQSIFRKREFQDKYKDRFPVKAAAGALMFSIIAIMLGLIFAVFYDLFIGSANRNAVSLSTVLATFSQGQVILTLGIILFILIGLVFAVNYLWYNGYYFILRIISDLED